MVKAPQPIRTFSVHYREQYGQGVGKIPLDLGQVCPNRRRGGCIYCRPASFTPYYLNKGNSITRQLTLGKKHLLKGRFGLYLGYFQQESITSLPAALLLESCAEVLADKACVGLILSTRPDCIYLDLLAPLATLIERSGKECLFELGLQSIHRQSLEYLNRNHTLADFINSAKHIQSFACFTLGAHLILGIPGESKEQMGRSVQQVCALKVNALKLHHLQVIEGTPLHQLYTQGEVELFSLEKYLELLLYLLPMIPPEVVIHRLWATAHPDVLVAPRWKVLAAALRDKLDLVLEQQGVHQGSLLKK